MYAIRVFFSNLYYYNINKSIKLAYTCHAHVGVSSPPALLGRRVGARIVVKKGWPPTPPTRKVAAHLLGWRVLSFERWFDDVWSFSSSLYFLSPMPRYTCRALTNSVVSFGLYLFWVWSLFFWFLFFFRFNAYLSF